MLKVGGRRASWWKQHLSTLLPEATVYLADEAMNRDDMDYAVVWKPEPGWLKSFKNLKCIVSIGTSVNHAFRDPKLPAHLPFIRMTSTDLKVRITDAIESVLGNLRL